MWLLVCFAPALHVVADYKDRPPIPYSAFHPHAGATEQAVDLDSSEIYNFRWLAAVQMQSWRFGDAQAQRSCEYLFKGGFLMVDDFREAADWESFMSVA